MLHRLALAAAFALAALATPAQAQQITVVPACGASSGLQLSPSTGGRFAVTPDGTLCTVAGAGGGSAASGSVTPGGTPGTQAQAVQGIPNGVPQNVIAQDAVVPTGYPATITATGPLPGFRTTGANSVMFAATGTVSAIVQYSLDSTNGVDGTWATLNAGSYPKDNTYFYVGDVAAFTGPAAATESVIVFPATAAPWLRVNVNSFSAGATAGAWLRSQPYVPRTIGLRPLPGGSNQLGTVTIRGTGTNRSVTIGTTATTVMVANGFRFGWKVKNDSTGDIWINFDGAATAAPGGGNIKIPAGGYMSSEPGFVETGAMSAIGSAAGLNITAREH